MTGSAGACAAAGRPLSKAVARHDLENLEAGLLCPGGHLRRWPGVPPGVAAVMDTDEAIRVIATLALALVAAKVYSASLNQAGGDKR